MSFLKSIGEDGTVIDAFKAFPEPAPALIHYHEIVMRGPSELTSAERESIAAYVSLLNRCSYCAGVHEETAAEFDQNPDVLRSIIDNIETAPIGERYRPVFRFVEKLTRSPGVMARADADAILEAGWSERAIHDIVSVCALFNFMNRYVQGLGIHADGKYFRSASRRLSTVGYEPIVDMLGTEPDSKG